MKGTREILIIINSTIKATIIWLLLHMGIE